MEFRYTDIPVGGGTVHNKELNFYDASCFFFFFFFLNDLSASTSTEPYNSFKENTVQVRIEENGNNMMASSWQYHKLVESQSPFFILISPI